MKFKPTREFMITNRNLNTMIKPNNIDGEYTVSGDSNIDAGISVLKGKINHHFAMVIDIIYDHIYRLLNENEEREYIEISLRNLLSNESVKHEYFTNLITDKKLDFYSKVLNIGEYYTKCSDEKMSFPYDKETRDFLLNGCRHLISNAFPPDFYMPYRAALESECEKEGTLDKPLTLLAKFQFERQFFRYLLKNIFYGRYPTFNNYKLKIDLSRIFENNERTVYVIKKWFEDANNVELSMTYPVTCFTDYNGSVPRRIHWKTHMMPIIKSQPVSTYCDKSKMVMETSLNNKFMVYMANDAKMCVGTYIPSSLYTLNSNAYFIGKGILSGTYYSKKEKKLINKKNYTISDMFDFLNLPEKDIDNRNNSHRRKAIFKALRQLDTNNIIKLDRMNQKEITLSEVWNISKNDCIKDED